MNTVITSNEPDKIVIPDNARPVSYVEARDAIIWKYKTEDEAIRAARAFMNAGFEYVKREF